MRYFAMIDGECRGPFELSELTAAGVHPDTYVWCKGMADWEKAEDVADICRHYRQTIFDRMHPPMRPKGEPRIVPPRQAAPTGAEDPYAQVPLRFRNIMRQSGQMPEFKPETANTSVPPAPTLFIAIFLTLFCFPITGLVAIYFSYKARKTWAEASRSESKKSKVLYSDQEREQLRVQAHDFDRQAKMWIGITFFLGMIFSAFLVNYHL